LTDVRATTVSASVRHESPVASGVGPLTYALEVSRRDPDRVPWWLLLGNGIAVVVWMLAILVVEFFLTPFKFVLGIIRWLLRPMTNEPGRGDNSK